MRTLPVRPLLLAALILGGGLGACGDEKEGGPALGAGGSPGSGGRRGFGGSGGQTSGTGGTSASGGSGGATASGGTTGSGGSPEVDATLGTDTTLGTDGAITETAEEAPPAPLCTTTAAAMAATPADAVIDDFEDGDANILARDGRMGGWWLSMSATATVTGMAAGGPPVPVAGGSPGRALHVSGMETGGWGVSLSANVAESFFGCYDLSAYTTLELSLKGRAGSKVIVLVRTAQVRALPPFSVGWWGLQVTLTANYQKVRVKLADLMPSWGAPPPFDATKVFAIDVNPVLPQVNGMGVGEFDYWVDNLALVK
jgi:hypothetical protein